MIPSLIPSLRARHFLLLAFVVALSAGLIFLVQGRPRLMGAPYPFQKVEQPLPVFALPGMEGEAGLSNTDFIGSPKVLNLFASWCLPCVAEAPALAELHKQGAVIHGVAVRDQPENTQKFLAQHGNPFVRIGQDADGRLLRRLGAEGVPQTYLVDGRGVIRFVYKGEVRPEHVSILLARLEQLR